MSGCRWKYRPVVVPGSDAAFAEQHRRIAAANRAGLAERDIVVIWVTGNNIRAEAWPWARVTATQLRSALAPPKQVRVVLAGEDGGAKLTQSKPLSAETHFGTIDSMP